MNDTKFNIGDLVEFADHETIIKESFGVGLVIGFKQFSDWNVNRSKHEKTTAVVVLWNSGMETNTSPLVLRKL